MKNYTTFVSDREIEIYYANALSSGYGHKEITVEILYKGEFKKFTETTSNMRAYDAAMELDGKDKEHAFYLLIENYIIEKIEEWLDDVDEQL